MRGCLQRASFVHHPSIIHRRPGGCNPFRHICLSAVRCGPALSPASSHSLTSSPFLPPLPSATSSRHTASQSSPTLPSQRLQNAHIITALHTTRALLPSILLPDSPELLFWNSLLLNTSQELAGVSTLLPESESGKIKVVVYAVDEFACADALVEALLEHPFASDAEIEGVCGRWKGRTSTEKLDIQYGKSPPTPSTRPENKSSQEVTPPQSDTVYVSSPFLNSFPAPIHLTELRPSPSQSSFHQPTSPSVDHLQALFSADIPIIVVNSLTTPLSSLFPPARPSSSQATIFPYAFPAHALIVLTAPSPTVLSPALHKTLTSHLHTFDIQNGAHSSDRVFLVDPARAVHALHSLRSSPSNPSNVQRYQDDTLGSGISEFVCAFKSLLPQLSPSTPPADFISYTHANKASALLQAALSTLRGALTKAESELHLASRSVRALQGAVADARVTAQAGVLGSGSERVGGDEAALTGYVKVGSGTDVATNAMDKAQEDVKQVMDTLSWWHVLWRADEVGWTVKQAVRSAWAGELERAILPAYSTLPAIQAQLAAQTRSHLAALPPALHSALLTNSLAQLTASPSYPVSPTTMLGPLTQRREILDDGPTAYLARAAQALVLRVGGSTLGGAGTAVLGSRGAGVQVGSRGLALWRCSRRLGQGRVSGCW
ncbi:hypothetical protein EW146_g1376 [Bondarzewia mesenterica]|uniref:Uncharacterized protein n=1 Tax=Bondarzewia mesenterica TaxID=1095465 RepID=A0A4V3XG32_9AGAM|nr:hypothetical protein EW146_g1376 [Bondarzewia mesenterica]